MQVSSRRMGHPPAVAREVLAADLALLADLDDQIGAAEAHIAVLLPVTDYQILTTTPGWSVIRAASYAAALAPQPSEGRPPKGPAARRGCAG